MCLLLLEPLSTLLHSAPNGDRYREAVRLLQPAGVLVPRGGKGRSKREMELHTNRHCPAGHERKIVGGWLLKQNNWVEKQVWPHG
uniref:Uncharacterized protein n=1 Tax=Sphaeramia orbicularis TaxID=375764 RepID=A0A673AUT5_9TELE